MPLCGVSGGDGKRPRLSVKLCVQLDQIEDAVFSRVDQGVRVRVHQRRGIEIAQIPAEGEGILVSEGVHDAAVQQVHDEDPRLSLAAVIARTHVKDRIAAGVQSSRPLKGEAEVDGIPGGISRHQVQEIDLTVHAGIDHLHQVILFLRTLVHVHVLLHVPGPLHEKGLPGPAAAGPQLVPVLQCAGALFPDRFDGLFLEVCKSEGRIVAPVVSAEGDDAVKVVVVLALSELKFVPWGIIRVVLQPFSVELDTCGGNEPGGLCGIHAVGLKDHFPVVLILRHDDAGVRFRILCLRTRKLFHDLRVLLRSCLRLDTARLSRRRRQHRAGVLFA